MLVCCLRTTEWMDNLFGLDNGSSWLRGKVVRAVFGRPLYLGGAVGFLFAKRGAHVLVSGNIQDQ
jgi:hypothetical protein